MLKSFCKKNDGGAGNALPANRQLNDDIKRLYNLGAKVATSEGKGADGTTTTTETYDARYTRAVYSQAFNWIGDSQLGAIPGPGNSWGLKVNPCWPEAIVPDDPGWVLQNSDPWYQQHGAPAVGFNAYRQLPPVQSVVSANSILVEHGYWGVSINGYPAPPAAPNKMMMARRDINQTEEYDGWTPRGRSLPNRGSLVMEDGSLVVRDEETGAERKIARDEIADFDELEVIQCDDEQCTKERRALAEHGDNLDDWVLMPAAKRSMSPPEYVEAISTSVPVPPKGKRDAGAGAAAVDASPSPSRVAVSFGRRAPEHALPRATGRV